jgi:hypothetical protein
MPLFKRPLPRGQAKLEIGKTRPRQSLLWLGNWLIGLDPGARRQLVSQIRLACHFGRAGAGGTLAFRESRPPKIRATAMRDTLEKYYVLRFT